MMLTIACLFVLLLVGANGVRPRRTDITTWGYRNMFRGWVDVQGQGANNDYCRCEKKPKYHMFLRLTLITNILVGSPGHCAHCPPACYTPAINDWCNKGRGMCYHVCGMVHIKEPLLLIDRSSLCGGIGFPFSLSEWSATICLTPYNRR